MTLQRRWANISLVSAVILLVLALLFGHQVWAPYVRSMALAALAGGIADWYAVTALFRHPFGWKWLPHTSIISANRERIIDALSRLVETELLSSRFLEARLGQIDWQDVLQKILTYDPSPSSIEFVQEMGRGLRNVIPVERVAPIIQQFTSKQVSHLMLSDGLVRILKWLIQSDNDRALFQFLSRHAVSALSSVEFTEDMEMRLKALLEQYTKTTTQKLVLGLLESLGTVDYRVLSREIKEHLIKWLESDKAYDQFELILVRMMVSLREDEGLRTRIEAMKDEAITHFPWEKLVETGFNEFDQWLDSPERIAGQWQAARQMVQIAWEDNADRQSAVIGRLQQAIVGIIRRFHPVIGRLVRQNLEQMNDREWIDKLEWYVGQDLQWIRINGALVGGLVGLLLAVITHL